MCDGCTADDDEQRGPAPGQAFVDLVGGALDGQLLDVTGWSGEQLAQGAFRIMDRGLYGADGWALHGPIEADPERPFGWIGDTPCPNCTGWAMPGRRPSRTS
ncbi:hypothetical protein [Streptomyces sp. NPDC006270]|uniref:hypothetical protein n=1 Tax=Streptomyces sp. NPDC006270 TaxID=3364741 RepID=UPI0036C3E14A